MSRRYDCSEPDQRTRAARGRRAVRRGDLVVLPTDTVYGIGADAFSSAPSRALLAAKGRGRDMPVPVLVGSPARCTASSRIPARRLGPGRRVLAGRA